MPLIEKPLPGHANMVFKVVIPPESEPITAEEVRSLGRIETDAEDTLIETMITAVREIAESWLGRALLEQTIEASFDYWPENPVKLPRPPLISVDSIVTVDEENQETLYSVDNYFFRTSSNQKGEVIIKNGAAAPTNTDRYYGGFKITYTAGYGDQVEDVPQGIKLGLMEWVLHAVENRIISREPPEMAMPLLGAYRIRNI